MKIKESVTLNDVARLANVSNATVSRYLNKTTGVDAKKADIIEDAIKTLGFRINRNARMLKTNRSMQIMMIVPDIENPFYSVAYKIIQEIALKKNFTVMLYNTNSVEKNELNAIEMAYELNCDGMIFCSTYDYPSVFEALKTFDKPIVASNSFDQLYFDTVHSIKGQGIYTTTSYLIKCGHKKIAYIGGDEKSILNQRRQGGYLRALEEVGIEVNKDYIFCNEFNMEGGYKAITHFMSLPDRPTGIACANDLIAMGAIQAAVNSGVSVPNDLSVCGMDNIEYSKLCIPPITTVTNNSSEFAVNCMELLYSRITEEYVGLPRELLNSRQLIVRGSTKILV